MDCCLRMVLSQGSEEGWDTSMVCVVASFELLEIRGHNPLDDASPCKTKVKLTN